MPAAPPPGAGAIDGPARPRGTSRERRLAEAGLLATALLWSANFVVVKATIGVLGPLSFTGLRYGVASITLLLLLKWRLGTFRWPAGHGLQLLGMGLLGFGAYQVLWTIGLTQITAGNSALLVAISPVLTALLAGAVGMDRLTAPKLAGALISFTGVALVIGASHELSLGTSLVGDLFTLTAAALWAVYTVLGARILRVVDPLQATTWTVVGGSLLLVPLGAWELATQPPDSFPVAAVVAILYSGALAAGVANVLVFRAIRVVGPTRVAATQFLVPACAVALGAVFLAEPVGIAQLVGGAVIVLGVWLTRRQRILPAALRARLSSVR